MATLSQRACLNVAVALAKLRSSMLQDTSVMENAENVNTTIDLSMAENWLIREEILGIGKPAIEREFDLNVRVFYVQSCPRRRLLRISYSIFPCQLPLKAIQPSCSCLRTSSMPVSVPQCVLQQSMSRLLREQRLVSTTCFGTFAMKETLY